MEEVTKKLSKEERCELVAEVYNIVFENTSTFTYGRIGVGLAYLFGAIAKDSQIDRDEYYKAFFVVLDDLFPKYHKVWLFVRAREEEGTNEED